MNKWLVKLSKLLGFTKNELQIILFLLVAFFIGLVVFIIKEKQNNPKLLNFNYQAEDSMFFASMEEIASDDTLPMLEKKQDEIKNTNGLLKKKNIPPGKIISINSAKVSDLITLPGIGIKTAENIVSYRQKYKGFKSIDELAYVKGIGKTKLNKIRNMLSL